MNARWMETNWDEKVDWFLPLPFPLGCVAKTTFLALALRESMKGRKRHSADKGYGCTLHRGTARNNLVLQIFF